MVNIFTQLIDQLNSAVFILLIILFALVYGIFKIAWWLGEHQEKESTTAKRLDNVKTKLDSLKDIVMEMKGKLELIYNNTLAKNSRMTGYSSPIAITDKGKEVPNKLKIQAIVERTYKNIKDALTESNEGIFSKNEYDIQGTIFAYISNNIENHLSAEELNAFKTEAYKRGILIDDLYRIIAVLFRDKLFSDLGKHVADIDKHDPNG